MRTCPRIILMVGVASLFLALGESQSFAQRPYYNRGYGPQPSYAPAAYGWNHQHDGFYLRAYAGLGYFSASETYGGATDTYSGIGATYGAAFGGTIARNLILYGELLGTTVTNATLSYGGGTPDYSGVDLTMFGIGPGVAYYVEPINLYLSGTLTFTQISFSDTNTAQPLDSTNLGVGLSFMVGKEWWVSPDWGIGIAGQVHIASMEDPTVRARMRASVISLLFSATYN